MGEENNQGAIDTIDEVVLKIAEQISAPQSRMVRYLLKVMSKFETKQVAAILSKLKAD